MEMLAGMKWISCEERNPETYGKYRVICMQRGQRTEDDYLWNGSYWVTPKGSPSKGVQAWAEQNVPAVKTEAKMLTLADYEARIHLYKEQIGTGYIGIGRTLNEAKDAGVVPHGQWEQWVTATTGLTPRQAQRCMQAATEIRDGSALARLEMSKALMLLSSGLDEEERETMAERVAEEGTTVKALRDELKRVKLQAVENAGAAAEIREELKRAESERQSLEYQLKATISTYSQKLDEESEKAYMRGIREQEAELEKARKKAEVLRGKLENAVDVAREELDHEYQEALEHANRQNTILAGKVKEARQEAEEEVGEELAALRKTQKDLLDAAAEAEQRAADAEAELEALRAGKDPDKVPAVIVLNRALSAFYGECELMPWYPEELRSSRQPVLEAVAGLESWCERMRAALDAAVPAEGAVK